MKTTLRMFLAGIVVLCGALGGRGASQLDLSVFPGMSKVEEELTWRNDSAGAVLSEIAEEAGVNIVVDRTVTGSVTMTLKNVTRKDVFDIIVYQNKLAYVMRGSILYVMSGQEYEDQYGKRFSDARVVKVFRLKYAIPERAFAMVENLKSELGNIVVDEESGTVLIIDTQENIDRMEETLQVLESKGEIEVIHLNYADAKGVQERLVKELDEKKVGTIVADEKTNSVIVRALPDRMTDVKELIAALDKKTKQALIDTKIVQLSLKDSFDAEIRWEGIFRAMTSNGLEFLGSHPLNPMSRLGQSNISEHANLAPATVPQALPPTMPGEQVYFGVYDDDPDGDKVEGMLRLLRTLGEVKILSNPKLAVVNNMEAKILVGRRQAFITTTTSQAQTTTTVAEDINFVDIGIILRVTPKINDLGYVTMAIKPEVSSVVDTLVTPGGNPIPIIDSSEAETTVIAKDGSTILIGGLRKEEESIVTKRVPFFSSIPILGYLFRSKSSVKLRSEVLVMITPHIVSGDVLMTAERASVAEGLKPYIEYTAGEGVSGSVPPPAIRGINDVDLRDRREK
jgi:type II secretory pathway component GspD/PulD (secretin)